MSYRCYSRTWRSVTSSISTLRSSPKTSILSNWNKSMLRREEKDRSCSNEGDRTHVVPGGTAGNSITDREDFPLSSAYRTNSKMPESVSKVLPPPVKGKLDEKEYRSIELPNGLKALLVSDKRYPLDKLDEEEKLIAASVVDNDEEDDEEDEEEDEEMPDEEEEEEEEEDEGDEEEDEGDSVTHKKVGKVSSGLKKSACALCVGIGSFSDPVEVPGLAHFLEHMVFMGSKKYPKENSFDRFIQKSGGYDNASTDCENTVFYFEIQRRCFREGLDRFAQFFINPLLRKESMKREREAVDSEFEMAVTSDYNRKQQLFGTLAQAGHPMAKFMWGNTKSLQMASDSEVHEMLVRFKDRHYSSHAMTLVVQSQEELDTLQQWVEESFCLVPNNGLEKETFFHMSSPFDSKRFHRIYKICPIKNVYQLDLNWALPEMLDKFREKPLHYLSWIIGHEGNGSLISYLRKKVWALSLTAGNAGDDFEFNSTYSVFTITIVLTKSGFDNLEKVLEGVFSYIKMLHSQEPSERIFREIQKIEDLDFQFSPEIQPAEYVEKLCLNMQFYPPELYLTGDDLMFRFDPGLIKDCLSHLSPEKVNIILMSKEYAPDCDQIEPWFNTMYAEEDIPDSWLNSWKNPKSVKPDVFYLPSPNQFIAEDVTVKAHLANINEPIVEHPVKIISDQLGEMFYKLDAKFLKPRAYINIYICSPVVIESLRNAVAMDLFISCACQVMVEATYPADLAQLSYSCYMADRGVVVKVSGLNDKLSLLLHEILSQLANAGTAIKSELFKAVQEQHKKALYNHFIKPMKLAKEVRLSVLQNIFRPSFEKHSVISSLTLDEVISISQEFFRSTFVQCLVQGNMTSDEATEIYEKVKRKLDLQPIPSGIVPEFRCRALEPGERILRCKGLNPHDGNTVVTNYYQWGPGDLKNHALLEMLLTIMDEPAFDQLRTKEQLGYTVFSQFNNTFGIFGFNITICAQASKYTADHVESRIDAFLKWLMDEKLGKMSKEDFDAQLRTLIELKRADDVALEEEVSRNWGEIVSREYLFNRTAMDVSYLEESVTAESVTNLLKDLIQGGKDFKKLSVQVVGSPDEQEGEIDNTVSEDPEHKFSLKMVWEERSKTKFVPDILAYRDKLEVHELIHVIK